MDAKGKQKTKKLNENALDTLEVTAAMGFLHQKQKTPPVRRQFASIVQSTGSQSAGAGGQQNKLVIANKGGVYSLAKHQYAIEQEA